MIKILSATASLCALNLMAQLEVANTSIRGEVKGLAAGSASTFMVEAYDAYTHLRLGQSLVSGNGNFELNMLPRGNYELRLVGQNGQPLQTQFISPSAAMQMVAFEIPEQPRSAGPASGSVDFSQLGHRIDPHSLKIFQKALKAIARADHQEAIQLLLKAIEADPAYAQAHLELAIQYGITGDSGHCLEESQTAVRLAPGDARSRLTLAIVFVRLNRLPDAETEARAALRLDPGNTKASFLTGAILVGEGKITPETLAYLKRAYADYPKARELGARLEQRLAH